MSENLNYRPRDERVGLWSDVAFGDDKIAFVPRPTHQRGRYLGLAATAFVLVFFVGPLISKGLTPGELIVGLALAGLIGVMGVKAYRQRPSPVIVSQGAMTGAPNAEENRALVVASQDVVSVIARENNGRYSEDTALAQLYLQVDEREAPLLVHQDYLNQAEQIAELGQRIAAKLGVKFVNKLVEPAS
jgi:hypothetical protein